MLEREKKCKEVPENMLSASRDHMGGLLQESRM